MKMIKRVPRIQLSLRQEDILERISDEGPGQTRQTSIGDRAEIILLGTTVLSSIKVAKHVNTSVNTVLKWWHTWRKSAKQLKDIEAFNNDKRLEVRIRMVLTNEFHHASGQFPKFNSKQVKQIIALACGDQPYIPGKTISRWTIKRLTDEAMKCGIAKSISVATTNRFLVQSGILKRHTVGRQYRTSEKSLSLGLRLQRLNLLPNKR